MQNRTQINPVAPCNAIVTGSGIAGDVIGTGFSAQNFAPAAAFGTISMTAAGAIDIAGSLQAGKCIVTLTPFGESNISWTFATTAGKVTAA